MAVDLSNRTFLFKETLPVIGSYMSAKFSAKKSSPSGLYFSAMSQIANTLTFQYVPGTSNLTVYNSGWVDNDYRRITFADGVSVSDSLYAWLIQLADEVEDPFLTKTEDLDIVANAIRERSWDYRQLTYPNGYAAAINAIGNRVTGGSVAWNQLVNTTDTQYSYTYSSDDAQYYKTVTLDIPLIPGHKYLWGIYANREISGNNFLAYHLRYGTVSMIVIRLYDGDENGYYCTIFNSEYSAIQGIMMNNYNGKGGFNTGDVIGYSDNMLIDLTAALGQPIADYLYTLESGTPGAGVAKFKELFPDDYYPYNAGSLLSVAYGEWPQNTPKTLYGVLDLHNDSWVRYGDIYTNRIVYEQMRVRGFIGTPSDWGYNNIHDFFHTTSRPGGFGYYSFFMSFDKIGPCITDAYPYGGSFNAEQTDPTVDPTLLKDGYWMVGWLPSNSTYLIYVKDSSITSDYLNEFTTKNAGKTLIGFTNNRQFVLP